jgi:hypothetical protein
LFFVFLLLFKVLGKCYKGFGLGEGSDFTTKAHIKQTPLIYE